METGKLITTAKYGKYRLEVALCGKAMLVLEAGKSYPTCLRAMIPHFAASEWHSAGGCHFASWRGSITLTGWSASLELGQEGLGHARAE